MRILVVSDLETQGGAAIACSRLVHGLVDCGHEVVRLVNRGDGGDSPWRVIEFDYADHVARPWLSLRNRLPRLLRDQLVSALMPRAFRRLIDAIDPDVINLHNLHFAIHVRDWPLQILRAFSDSRPVVWTLHDMWSFTGRCAYRYECAKHLVGCDASCPTPKEYPVLSPNQIARAWKAKAQVLGRNSQMQVVCPSRWLADEALAGLWAGHPIHVIPYGLELNVYRPLDRAACRSRLGLATDAMVLLVVAADFADRRKGMHLLSEALPMVAGERPILLAMGGGELPDDIGGCRVVALGRVSDPELKCQAYSAANLFVHPSVADNLPNVLLESVACGTPCAGFVVGGVPEVIRPGLTGWLAGVTSAECLASTLSSAVNELRGGKDLRSTCRRIAEEEYGLRGQAVAYESLFARCLKKQGSS